MATGTDIEFIPGPGSRLARAGTPVGDQKRNEFLHNLEHILGDSRLIWLPKKGDTTTTTNASRHARTLSYDASVASRRSLVGSGVAIEFDGTDDEADTPDQGNLSFGDGAVDQAFSVFALVNLDDSTSSVVLSKFDTSAGQEEWLFELDASDRPRFALYDDSASARIGRLDATALAQSAWKLLVATYDGSRASTGMRLYLDGARVDDTDDNVGTYTAMENGTELVALGYRQAAGAKENFFDGKMALVGLAAKELSEEEVWVLKEAVNGYFDLSI